MGALFGFSGPPDRRSLERMGAVLRHRGRGDLQLDEAAEGTLACRSRTPPAALERTGAQARSGVHRDGRLAIALAGELYGEPGSATLGRLLERYRREGLGFLPLLRGAFVLALRDGETLHLVRDGAGARTLYHGTHAGRLWFAVEPKGVLAAPGFPRRLRPGAVAQYLSFSFIPGAATMLEDLAELPAGHVLSIAPRRPPRLERYFRFELAADVAAAAEADWPAEFRRRHALAVRRRLGTGRRAAVFLSGGLDSSAVTAELSRQCGGGVRSFSIHFGEGYPNELEFARSVAERHGTEHEEVLIRPKDFLPRLRRMVWHLDEPIGDPITMPNFELAARAADAGFEAVFNGEGGDPCFGGPKNIPMLLQHWYGGLERDPRFRERAYLESYRRGYDEVERLISPALRTAIDPGRDLENVLSPFFAASDARGFLDKLCAINIRLKGAHLILPKVERMLGAFGLRPHSPMFDEDLVRLSFEMPSTMRLAGGVEKVVIKHAYRDELPASVIERPKSGMRVPVHSWFRGELRRYARSLLSSRAVKRAGVFDPARVQQLLRYETSDGPGRFGLRIWMLVTFELWRRMVLDGESV